MYTLFTCHNSICQHATCTDSGHYKWWNRKTAELYFGQPVVSPSDKLMQEIIYFSNTIYDEEQPIQIIIGQELLFPLFSVSFSALNMGTWCWDVSIYIYWKSNNWCHIRLKNKSPSLFDPPLHFGHSGYCLLHITQFFLWKQRQKELTGCTVSCETGDWENVKDMI